MIADSLLGEITPSMAAAVGQSRAKRILIPFNHCDTILVGVSDFNIGKLVKNAVTEIQYLFDLDKPDSFVYNKDNQHEAD